MTSDVFDHMYKVYLRPTFDDRDMVHHKCDLNFRLCIKLESMQYSAVLGSFGLNGTVPWLKNTDGALCFICKEDIKIPVTFSGLSPV